jgi:hypothetical protein
VCAWISVDEVAHGFAFFEFGGEAEAVVGEGKGRRESRGLKPVGGVAVIVRAEARTYLRGK